MTGINTKFPGGTFGHLEKFLAESSCFELEKAI